MANSKLSAVAGLRRLVFVPGLRLMGRLRVPAKLSLVIAMLSLPMLGLVLASAVGAWQDKQQLDQRERALPLAHQMLALQRALGQAPGDGVARATVQAAVKSVDEQLARQPQAVHAEHWAALRQALPAKDSAAQRAAQDRLLLLATDMATRSGLALDSDRRSYLLAHMALERVNAGLLELARLREHLVAIADDGVPAPHDKVEMAVHAEALRDQLQALAQNIDTLAEVGGQAPASWSRVRSDTGRLFGLVDLARTDNTDLSVLRQVPDVSRAVEMGLGGLGEDLLVQAAQRLQERRAELAWGQALRALAALAGLLAGAYLAATFHYSFSSSLRAVTEGVQALTQGDLSQRFRVLGSDELAQVTRSLEGMAARLSALVAEIRSSAVRVDQSGNVVAADGQALAQRNDEQGQHLRSTVSSVASLDSAVQQQGNALASAHDISRGLQQQVESSREAVGHAVGAVQALEASVRRVAEINAAIDDVAFQTNLLALNASVEAARAGVAGKGFAVVAQEVRQLAIRCTEAAAQVRNLVDQSLEQATLSMATIDDAQAALRGVGNGLTDLGQRLDGLAESGQQQSRLIHEAREGVHGLESIALDNGAMVQKAAASSQELAAQARSLRQSVAATRLRQGSADEARALLERAMAHVARVGWAQAAQDFNDPVGEFVDRDMYIYALDGEDRYLVDGSTPARVGRRMVDAVAMDAERVELFIQGCRTAAAQGGGWVDYDFVAKGETRPVRKSGYVLPLGEGFIGCSVHRNDADAPAATEPARLAQATSQGAGQGANPAPAATPSPREEPALA